MTTYERMLATHSTTVGSYNEVPHNYFDPTTGEFSGVDWDIMKYILDKWGVTEINPIVADWSALIPGLQARRWDFISVGMSITDKREEVIDFSIPEFAYGLALVVPEGNPENLKSTADFKGHRIGAILGSTTYEAALAMEGVEAVPYSTHNDMINDLVAGRIDAVWADEIVSGYAQVQNPQPVEIIGYDDKEFVPTGAGFNSDDDDLREAWNKEIEQMIADGTMLKILQKYGLTQANIDSIQR
jgi:polar amino acid transport system substrate-binding protein